MPPLPGLPKAETQIAIPLLIRERLVGVFAVESEERATFSDRDEELASIVGNLAASAIHNAVLYRRIEQRTEELGRELSEVRAQTGTRLFTIDDIVGESRPMKAMKRLLKRVASSPSSTVLLTGENGTGKDLAAKVLHGSSSRPNAPFTNITCSALPEALLESELFGHERGAFTDARQQKKGLLELADGGTVFQAMGCHDCHTPKKMGPHGPEPDFSRALSGHPEDPTLPPPPQLPAGPWMATTSWDLTAWSGPWGISYPVNLTPDENTGLGIWTEDMFMTAMRTGRHMGASRPILPPMP